MLKRISLCLTCIALTACKPLAPNKSDLESLSEQFYKANASSNIEAMLELYELGNASSQMVGFIRTAIEFEIGIPINRISFEPLTGAPEETIDFTHQGVTYGSSLEPRYRMIVSYSNDHASVSKFTIGKNANKDWRIVTAVPIKP
jgi:hypothetical protein|tara:strand:- start:3791 stop:4225 length:435 start_codon:yes stop_codon:yes gene_type:complete